MKFFQLEGSGFGNDLRLFGCGLLTNEDGYTIDFQSDANSKAIRDMMRAWLKTQFSEYTAHAVLTSNDTGFYIECMAKHSGTGKVQRYEHRVYANKVMVAEAEEPKEYDEMDERFYDFGALFDNRTLVRTFLNLNDAESIHNHFRKYLRDTLVSYVGHEKLDSRNGNHVYRVTYKNFDDSQGISDFVFKEL